MEEKIEFNCVDIIEKNNTKLYKQGGNYVGICPFHNESNKSLTVNPTKNFWHCFGCGAGGDAVKFVSLKEHISYKDAYEKLCVEYGYAKPEETKTKPENVLYQINEQANELFVRSLERTASGVEALRYLKDRGLTDEVIQSFGIGFTANKINQSTYKNILLKLGYNISEIQEAGLLNSKETDLFQGRITLPIKNEFGDIQGFVGRTISNNIVRYLNTAETPIFKKGECLFNLDKAVDSKTEIYIVEGSFDVIAMTMAGFKNTVCSLGTSLTEEQLVKLKSFTNKVIISFDGDNAGINATIKAYKLIKKVGLNASFVSLKGKDASDICKEKGPEGLKKEILENTFSFYDWFFKTYIKESNTPEENDTIQKKFFALLKSETSLIQKVYLEKWAKLFNLSVSKVFKDFSDMFSLTKLYSELNAYFILNKTAFLESIKLLGEIDLKEEKDFLNSLFVYYKTNDKFEFESFNKQFPSEITVLNKISKKPLLGLKEILINIYAKKIEERIK